MNNVNLDSKAVTNTFRSVSYVMFLRGLSVILGKDCVTSQRTQGVCN